MPDRISVGRKRQKGGIEIGYESIEKIQEIPNFQAISRYREFLSIELENLIREEEGGIFDVCSFNLSGLVEQCNLPYRNLQNLTSILTENGIHGELSQDGITLNITKEGIRILDELLDSHSLENFLKKNLLTEKDFEGGKNRRTILGIGREMRKRGLNALTGTPTVIFAYNAFGEMEEGTDFRTVKGEGKDKLSVFHLLPPGIEKLTSSVKEQILNSILPKYTGNIL